MEAKKMMAESIKNQVDAASAAPSSGQKQSKGFILFCRVQGAMRHIPDFPETCRAILDAVMEEMDAENCSLMLKDPISGELSIRVARGRTSLKAFTTLKTCRKGNGSNQVKEWPAGYLKKDRRSWSTMLLKNPVSLMLR